MHGLGHNDFRMGQDPGPAPVEAEQEKSRLDKAVADFMAKIKAFYDNLTGMKMQAAFVREHPDLAPEYNALMSRGTTIDAAIKKAKAAIAAAQDLWSTVKGWFGLSGVADLEALPAIPIAIGLAAVAIAMITKWLADVYVFSKKIETIKATEAAGGRVSPTMRRILEAGTGPGLLDVLQRNIIWIVVGGALLMFGPEIMKMLRARR